MFGDKEEGLDLRSLTPAELRNQIREGRYTGLTTGLAAGVLQGNLVVLPADAADEFEAYCSANPRSLPLIERGRRGDPFLKCGADFDVRTDLPRYRVWRDGSPAEVLTDVIDLWVENSTAFIIGCWFANEAALSAAGIRLRHVELGIQGALYKTSIAATPAGRFNGPVVASMRPFAKEDADRVFSITEARPMAHGAPIHIGDPAEIGVIELSEPDFGDPIALQRGETPMFWACGLTGQEALAASGLPLFITHEPGHMAVTDISAG